MKRVILPVGAALALTAFSVTNSAGPGLAASEASPWSQANYNAAQSRANLTEHVLAPSAVPKVKYLRSVVSPLLPTSAPCPGAIVSPVLAGGNLYAVTNAKLSRYNAATGSLIWRSTPDSTFTHVYLDFGAALNATTGKVITTVWQPVDINSLPTQIAVGDGRIAVASDPRVLDLFGLPGS
jgi:outer membrane protein assembly factor BamB